MVNFIACLVVGSVVGLIGSVILNTDSTPRAYVNLISSVAGAVIGEFVFVRLVTAENNFGLAIATVVGSAFLLFAVNRVIYLIGKHDNRE